MRVTWVLSQFSLPALVYFAIALSLRKTISVEDLEWLLPNYLFMGGPHIVLGLSAIAFRQFRHTLPANLLAANVALVCFAAWLVSQVPPREMGLAWVLYFPLVCCLLAFAWLVRLRRGSHPASTSTPVQ